MSKGKWFETRRGKKEKGKGKEIVLHCVWNFYRVHVKKTLAVGHIAFAFYSYSCNWFRGAVEVPLNQKEVNKHGVHETHHYNSNMLQYSGQYMLLCECVNA
jgi:hypothetical protein